MRTPGLIPPTNGLLARFLAPPHDYRGLDVQYRNIRHRLLDEFQPQTFSARATIDSLAADYVQLVRARRMADMLSRPQPLSNCEDEQWQFIHEAKKNLRLIDRALAVHAAKGAWTMPKRDAKNIANRLTKLLRDVEEDIAAGQDADVVPLEDFEIEERKPQTAMLAAVGLDYLQYADSASVTVMLTGTKRVPRRQRQQLRAILEFAASELRGWLRHSRNVEKQAIQHADSVLAALALAPKALMLAQDYIDRIERGIERKLKVLRAG